MRPFFRGISDAFLCLLCVNTSAKHQDFRTVSVVQTIVKLHFSLSSGEIMSKLGVPHDTFTVPLTQGVLTYPLSSLL